jgi:hypothetical protein
MPRSGTLSATNPIEQEIREHIRNQQERVFPEKPATAAGYVPIDLIADEVAKELLEGQGGSVPAGSNTAWYAELAEFIVTLNGEMPFGEDHHIWRIYNVSVRVDHEMCKQKVVEARQRMAAIERIAIN